MNITFFRTACSKKQIEFANLLGISKQAYNRKELGYTEFKDAEKELILKEIKKTIPNATIEVIFFDNQFRKVLYINKKEK